uniref:Uncharacterized protein n=1 Tax=Glossina palpalis gambiensis TaxID=67801 RepID=A0A1B0BS83_9MUSC
QNICSDSSKLVNEHKNTVAQDPIDSISIPHATQDAQERFDKSTNKSTDIISTPAIDCALILPLPRRMITVSLLSSNTSLNNIDNIIRLHVDMNITDINIRQFNCSQVRDISPFNLYFPSGELEFLLSGLFCPAEALMREFVSRSKSCHRAVALPPSNTGTY